MSSMSTAKPGKDLHFSRFSVNTQGNPHFVLNLTLIFQPRSRDDGLCDIASFDVTAEKCAA